MTPRSTSHHQSLPTILLLVLFSTAPLLAADFTGKVVSVTDGDSIHVMHNGRAEEIRLNGIDCPEKGQAFGQKAKHATSELIFGKEVTLTTYGLDKYRRTIGDVFLPDGRMLNQELVKDGWCWWYRKYAPDNNTLAELEKEAHQARKGLWADPNPVPPWVFRKLKRGQRLDVTDLMLMERESEEGASPRGPPTLGAPADEPSAAEQSLATSAFPILGNRRSHIYHRLDCPNYSSIAPDNQVPFTSVADAEAAGYRRAKNCP